MNFYLLFLRFIMIPEYEDLCTSIILRNSHCYIFSLLVTLVCPAGMSIIYVYLHIYVHTNV